ncbi:Bug family tripartite tricarboxylate transporter substrate binding protein [Acidovorax cavernicola]|nr:tripartite tricarboxylate transporter substrate binding protein [Acidovorax cavernicola]
MNRREFSALLGAGLFLGSSSGHAESWPGKPVKLIVPFAAGSSPDIVNRLFANELALALGQPVIIDNRPGANGITGTAAALGAAPDGYTLLYVNVGTLAINPTLFPKQKYDPLVDLVPIALTASTMNALVVRPTLPVHSVQDLIAYAKAHPDKLTMGSSGTGTTGHLSGELFKEMAGITAVHVPYKGSSAAYTDIAGERVDFMFDNLLSVGPYAKDGRVRLLAVTASQRSALFPEVRTLQETGLKGYETISWGGIAAPRGTPQPLIQKLQQAAEKTNQSPAVKAFYQQTGTLAMAPMSAEQFIAFVKREQDKWAALVKRAGAANI